LSNEYSPKKSFLLYTAAENNNKIIIKKMWTSRMLKDKALQLLKEITISKLVFYECQQT
jgi:hypothetical protein